MISAIMLVRITHPIIREMTIQAIKSLRDNSVGSSPELILVRNGGDDLKVSRSDVGLPGVNIDLPSGLGLSEAYNLGVAKSHGDCICILHNDVVLPEGWNVALEKASRDGHIAFPMVDEEGSGCELRGVPKTAAWQTTGACFVMSRRTWDQLGGYDEGFTGFHWEDTDLFCRAMQKGIRLIRCPVTVKHWRGVTRSLIRGEESGFFDANLEYFKRKHGGVLIPRISETPQEV